METPYEKVERFRTLYDDKTPESWSEIKNYIEPVLKGFEKRKEILLEKIESMRNDSEVDIRQLNMKTSAVNMITETIFLLMAMKSDVNNSTKLSQLKNPEPPKIHIRQQKLF